MSKIKIFVSIAFIISFSGKIFALSDSVYKTDNIFSITYLNSLNKISEYENIKMTYIDSNSLRFEKNIYENGKWVSHSYKVNFNKISSFGYKAHATSGQIVGTGVLIGFGAGFVFGCVVEHLDLGSHKSPYHEPSFGERIALGAGFGLVFAVPALLISAMIPANPYENLDISKFDINKKFETIKRLIKKGVKKNI